MSTSMLVLLRELAEAKKKEGDSGITGTATSGTSTTLTDTTEPELYYSDADANLFDRWFVYNELAGATGRVNEAGLAGSTGILTLTGGEFGAEGTATAAVSTTTVGGTGTLTDTRVSWVTNQWVGALCTCNTKVMTVTSNDATTLTSTTDWDADPGDAASWTLFGVCPYILTRDDSPADLKNAINEVLRHDYVESWFPLSMHVVQNDCNDMEASTVATDYTAGGTAALAAETTTVLSGAQSLKVTASAANDYATTANISVNESDFLHAAALCSVTQGDDAELRIVNKQDTDAAIENATTDEPATMELVFNFSVPSGCEQIAAWMISVGSSDVTYWDDVQVWHDGTGVYPLPAYIQSPSQLLAVHAIPQGTTGPGADNDYRTNEHSPDPLRWEWVSKTPGAMRIAVICGSARPHLVTLRPRAELSTDTATSDANKDMVVDFALDLIQDPEKGRKRLGDHKAAILTAPNTHVQPRVGTRIG